MLTSLLFALSAWAAEPSMVERVLVSELERAEQVLAEQPEAPHYIALAVEDAERVALSATAGTLQSSSSDVERLLDVDLRVGTPELDSSHQLRGFSALEGSSRNRLRIPFTDTAEHALRHAVWREVDQQYRDASERIVMIRANLDVKVEEEASAPDFEPREGVVDRQEVPPLQTLEAAWKDLLVDLSARIEAHPDVHGSHIGLTGDRRVVHFVDTEGARLAHGRTHYRVSLQLQTTAPDGDVVRLFRAKDVHSADGLPDAEALTGWADAMVTELAALRDAPRASPWSGPVLLTGKAAGVFFHEVLGHRVEGHRQKREDEGRTFAEHVGRPILPPFIDVYDDPTIARMAGDDLNGFYLYDDEGVPAQRALLVEDGIFRGFLMSRSPIRGFDHSNGHGRRSAGNAPTARMGNTIIESDRTVPDAELRAQLVQEIQRQKLEYGYIIEEIEGGFTLTGRVMPNAFNVRATVTRRVFADGRPDQLVRGIDLVGTPLVAFGQILATGDTPEVFNGTCGAESGWVPVSAVAPRMLFRKLEFQLKEKGQERPPLLPKPTPETDGTAEVTR